MLSARTTRATLVACMLACVQGCEREAADAPVASPEPRLSGKARVERSDSAVPDAKPPAPSSATPSNDLAAPGDEPDAVAGARGECSKDDAEACFVVGQAYDPANKSAAGVAANAKESLRLYARACTLQSGQGCAFLGSLLMVEPTAVPGTWVRPLTSACDLGHAGGCRVLGGVYAGGTGVAVDPAAAARYWRRACTLKDDEACLALGYRYETGNGVDQDYLEAASLYRRACDNGYVRGCSMLGVMYLFGKGMQKDGPASVALLRRECGPKFDADFCFFLGVALEDTKDYVGAVQTYEKACALDQFDACSALGSMYATGAGVRKDAAQARRIQQATCQHDNPRGCWALGVMFENGAGGRRDLLRAAQLYRFACEHNFYGACVSLGQMYWNGVGLQKDESRARDLYERACRGDDSIGCIKAATMQRYGQGGDVDAATAAANYEKACKGNDPVACLECKGNGRIACLEYSEMLADGEGVQADPIRAMEFAIAACKPGSKSASPLPTSWAARCRALAR